MVGSIGHEAATRQWVPNTCTAVGTTTAVQCAHSTGSQNGSTLGAVQLLHCCSAEASNSLYTFENGF